MPPHRPAARPVRPGPRPSPPALEAGFIAAQAFVAYRRGDGAKRSPVPYFYIGAHAQTANLRLLTRDAARHRTYFPKVRLITPA